FFSDVLEMRMNLFFIFNIPHSSPDDWGMHCWGVDVLFTFPDYLRGNGCFHIVRYSRKSVSITHMYAGIGFVFAFQAFLFCESILQGRTHNFGFDSFIIYCTRSYMLETPAMKS
ncbi:hypothetical protein PMAYCL1PPCAC_22803, partial [Pristionchus mayeri]